MLLPILVFAGTLVYVLLPGLTPDLLIPVPVYACVIGTMAYTAAVRVRVERGGYLPGLLGALLFVCSDAILALGEFGPSNMRLAQTKLWVMVTYYAAQFFIAVAATHAPTSFSASAERKKAS